ncbi:hypothetical protein MRX96_023737 [Rhipicephalus microplus]
MGYFAGPIWSKGHGYRFPWDDGLRQARVVGLSSSASPSLPARPPSGRQLPSTRSNGAGLSISHTSPTPLGIQTYPLSRFFSPPGRFRSMSAADPVSLTAAPEVGSRQQRSFAPLASTSTRRARAREAAAIEKRARRE